MSKSLTLHYSKYGYTEALAVLALDHDTQASQIGFKRTPDTVADPAPRGELMRFRFNAPVATLAELSHQAIVFVQTEAECSRSDDAVGIAVDRKGRLWLVGTIGGYTVVAGAAAAQLRYDSHALLLILAGNLLHFALHLAQQLEDGQSADVAVKGAIPNSRLSFPELSQ